MAGKKSKPKSSPKGMKGNKGMKGSKSMMKDMDSKGGRCLY